MRNNWKSYFIITIFALLFSLWFSINGCHRGNSESKDYATLLKIHFRDSLDLIEKTNRLGQITITTQAYEISQKNLSKYILENSELKNKLANSYHRVNSVNETITNFHIDTIKVPVHDTIPCGDINKSYSVSDKFYSFDFIFKNIKGNSPDFSFLNFNIPDTTTEIIGVKKSGFMKLKHTLVSEQTHTNKYIQIKGVKTIVKSEAKPKTLRKILEGAIIGVIATIATENKIKKLK